jgi:hypothetical protein
LIAHGLGVFVNWVVVMGEFRDGVYGFGWVVKLQSCHDY